jgi:Na+-translocating ferredoxin:NAD+ oxidoreductase subunit G
MKVPETARLALTLGFAGLVSGLTLVGAYQLTLPRIKANQAAALERAVFEVLPSAVGMRPLEWRDGALRELPAGAGEGALYAGYGDDGRLVGYAIPGAGPGFQDTISLIHGYDPATRRVVGMAVLESRETPGLGDKIFKDQAFVAQFRDLGVEPPLQLVKSGRTEPHHVDAITGATISAQAVVKIVNQGNATWVPRLAEGVVGGTGSSATPLAITPPDPQVSPPGGSS